mmetsp:Transcript_32126/g.80018  ORF Transcript_32126/g.80018 Transcript_32126/m.80018 type:complete len:172 (+) Transcript_32126:598-1113(+)
MLRYEVMQVPSLGETSLARGTMLPFSQRHLWFSLCRLSKPIVSSVVLTFGEQWHTHTIVGPVPIDACQRQSSPYIDDKLLLVHIKCLDMNVWGRNETLARKIRYAHDLRRCSPLEQWVLENGQACAHHPSTCRDRRVLLPWRAQKRGVGHVQLVPEWVRRMEWKAPLHPHD